jgi:hypothetical protein
MDVPGFSMLPHISLGTVTEQYVARLFSSLTVVMYRPTVCPVYSLGMVILMVILPAVLQTEPTLPLCRFNQQTYTYK